jgi:tRNA A37 threonylcarbamoyladenosine synthetase subunit TsaC/SUA5/YrdC
MDLLTLRDASKPLIPAVSFRIISSVVSHAQWSPNSIKILARSFASGHITIVCDAKKTHFQMTVGASPEVIAVQIAAHVPDGFRALVDGPLVCVWRNDDFFAMVA